MKVLAARCRHGREDVRLIGGLKLWVLMVLHSVTST